MLHCPTCRGKLYRVHRTFAEKFVYASMYECQQCHTRRPEPRWYTLYLGDYPRCPRCGTYRLSRLSEPDRIDRHYRSLVSMAQGIFGANLYHCRYCRIQFHDLREPVAPEASAKMVAVGGAVKSA